jgi:hypothetical protein
VRHPAPLGRVLVQLFDNIIDPSPPPKAVLSRNLSEQIGELLAAHRAPLDQADDPARILDDRFLSTRLLARRDLRFGDFLRARQIPSAIQGAFFGPAFRASVIGDAALRGALPAMALAAAERTSQVDALSVGRNRQEKYPAMTTMLQASPQARLTPQNRPQNDIVLQNQAANLAPAIPVGVKGKMPLDRYCKKARL